MADADLLSFGRHCEAQGCHQLDFLPFQCDACGQIFCLDHRSYRSHHCGKAAGRETTTIVCPVCAKAVKLAPGQDPNAAFEAHTSQGCDPSNYAKVHRKLKCPVPGCKEKLTSISTYSCKNCSTDVCLKHRFPSDHDCATRKAAEAAAQQSSLAISMRNFLKMGSGKPVPPAKPARKQPPPRAQFSGQQAAAVSRSQQAAAAHGTAERCPQCGERFQTLQELLFHVEAYHPDGRASTVPASGIEQCPHCGQSFANAVTLVEHVERAHGRKELCVLC